MLFFEFIRVFIHTVYAFTFPFHGVLFPIVWISALAFIVDVVIMPPSQSLFESLKQSGKFFFVRPHPSVNSVE